MVKQEMTRVNIDILGISKVKWMGMGKFNLDDNYISYCGQESCKRKSSSYNEQKRLKYSTFSKTAESSWFISKANHSTSQ